MARPAGTPRPVPVTAQWTALWLAGVFGLVLLGAFVAFPGFLPPMSPRMSAAQVAAFYRDDTAMIRFSMILFDICGVMLVPFAMVIAVQMKRMATPTTVLAYCYLSAAASGATLFALADLLWLAAAFRPARDPQLILLVNDLAWMVFTAPVGTVVVQNLCLALAVRLDAGPRPVFPRWVAPFSVVTGLAMVPAAGGAVVTSGPLAWDGAVSFWLRIAAYGVFFAGMFCVLPGAIRRQAAEEAA
ncbi:hypothetical protein [Actinomadura parmotrematis]|uniref:DUF4386 family protein n=1 Tax=Actinomadura parmotrematis TaxID=2864039 RepID=A0ABS7FQL0_9ACTN|nr:hypothetical protein [Actinomadura parmotrematis]MBW8482661.1 hypothetical protein [Actinomadura parmotrematis]